jgi:hypothetical protein
MRFIIVLVSDEPDWYKAVPKYIESAAEQMSTTLTATDDGKETLHMDTKWAPYWILIADQGFVA